MDIIKTIELSYKIDKEKYKVIVAKKNNKNTYIKIKEDLTIYVTTNYLATKGYIKSILDQERNFLKSSLHKVQKQQERNNNFYYLGKKYDIIMVPFENVEIDKDKIYVKSSNSLNKWIKSETVRIFKERLQIYYELFEEKIPYPILKIRSMKTRWGVCNKRDNSITLNSKLIKYTMREIDYVIVHELSHFVHFDHSREFWETVEHYKKDYKEAIKALKE